VATVDHRLEAEIIEEQKALLENYHSEYGIKLGLRVTLADIRNFQDASEFNDDFDVLIESFEVAAESGADVLSIESFGGKEVVSYALVRSDLEGVIFATGVLASIDVERL